MKPVTKEAVEKLYDETGIYQWHTTDKKLERPTMGVDFVFTPITDIEEAIEQINKALESSGLSYQMTTWTLPNEENLREEL